MTAPVIAPKHFIETQHDDKIHDAQFDFYGRHLATCASDGYVKVFALGDASGRAAGATQLVSELVVSTTGPVWQVAWAHPKFGTLLATCGWDGRAVLWAAAGSDAQPTARLNFQVVYEYTAHQPASVNAVAFAPHEYGLAFACASSDGRVSVCRRNEADGSWQSQFLADPATEVAHVLGATTVSWAPSVRPGGLVSWEQATPPPMRLATGGCDNLVRIWVHDTASNAWRVEGDGATPGSGTLYGHTDWVRSVAWCQGMGLPTGSLLASAGQDKRVIVWRQDALPSPGERGGGGVWKHRELPRFKAPCWGVSWSATGMLLAVSCGDQTVTLWKEGADGEWQLVGNVTEAGAQVIREREEREQQERAAWERQQQQQQQQTPPAYSTAAGMGTRSEMPPTAGAAAVTSGMGWAPPAPGARNVGYAPPAVSASTAAGGRYAPPPPPQPVGNTAAGGMPPPPSMGTGAMPPRAPPYPPTRQSPPAYGAPTVPSYPPAPPPYPPASGGAAATAATAYNAPAVPRYPPPPPPPSSAAAPPYPAAPARQPPSPYGTTASSAYPPAGAPPYPPAYSRPNPPPPPPTSSYPPRPY
ncbi:hypothetical protein CDCA_CDCA08G2320 [Cyanidium caldarium]|uniref:Protein transport protein SEC13 n=1 Tax=Cyanidium caldarium TaxID=2771 RepID=A0AAV9IW21_CYACA|nr:hypothetical protein CDCA_CDCA08G2320 [Cyanidium caldarium]